MTFATAKKKIAAHGEALVVAALSVVAVVYTHRRTTNDPERWVSIGALPDHGLEIRRRDGHKYVIDKFCKD